MSSTSTLRDRRTAAQLHALAEVRRHIADQDSTSSRKYLKEFAQAFRSYQSVINLDQLQRAINTADILLVGDYHALPASQRFAANLVQQRAETNDRPVVLAVETVFARDQHILDQWWRREIIELELRRRIRFDLDWGYDWGAFYDLLVTARECCHAVYGLDCMPRNDFRKLAARDRHATDKIREIRKRHPEAVIVVLCGESHLAPTHLPASLRRNLKAERTLTILQNIDALYWRAAGERDRAEAVRVQDDIVCVFNSSPLEKYESYRLWLSRWDSDPGAPPDVAPSVYNLIASLARFLNINCHAARNRRQPKFLVDSLPEIYAIETGEKLARQLALQGLTIAQIDAAGTRMEEYGCVYVPQINAFCVCEFRMMYVAEEAARFLHHACRGLPVRGSRRAPATFYAVVIETAIARLGSLLIHPQPMVLDEHDPAHRLANINQKATTASSDLLGTMLAESLYDAYLKGRVSRTFLRQLFSAPVTNAKQLFTETVARVEK